MSDIVEEIVHILDTKNVIECYINNIAWVLKYLLKIVLSSIGSYVDGDTFSPLLRNR